MAPPEVEIDSLPLSPLPLWSLILVASLCLLVQASNWFTDAAERLGLALGMSSFMIGVTIIAIGTSLPELVSSILAIIEGAPEIVAGNVIGSNIANLLLVLGLTGVVSKELRFEHDLLSVDMPFLAGSAMFLALIGWDGIIVWTEALFCLAGLVIYASYAVINRPIVEADQNDEAASQPARQGLAFKLRLAAILLACAGLIYLSADWTILAVVELAGRLGIGTEVIAASAVALGTSLPEVAVTLAAMRRGQAELAVGNIIGSNIFNAFAVVGISGLLVPLPVAPSLIDFALPVMIAASFLAIVTFTDREINKWEGALMLLFYLYFIMELLGFI